jgi:hypothetical protein
MLDAAKDEELECGGLYHGLAGLRIYRARVFGDGPQVPSKPSA